MPEIGDGIESGDVLEVLVREGDHIEKEQGIVEVETDKATVEIPSSHAGKVTRIHVTEGDSVKIGERLVSIDAVESHDASAESAPTAPPVVASPAREPAPPQATAPPPISAESAAPRRLEVASGDPSLPEQSDATIPAGPAVRRFAREVGVDLALVKGSGAGARITRDDLLAVVRQASRGAGTPAGGANTSSDGWGPVRLEKISRIRQTIANKMHESWTSAPRVTNFDDADVTELERIRQSSKADYADKGIKLTSMPFVIKSVAMALKDHPLLNAAIDMENRQVIFKEYINIGIAVDTDRGLVVPSLRNADKLPIPEIARQLAAIAENARTGGFKIEDLRGSSFTISNLGAIGGTYSTPIINVPEVAILLIGRARKMPVAIENDQVGIRLMMPLSISYDHRLVDGAAAARFLNEVIGFLKAPSRLLLAP
jgi:pyruvate/2-oxoglutarate dehydrogenase complex dihydrolipoamide acyltransferase (E2) component